MARRLIIDTGVLVMSKRGRGTYADAIQADDDLSIAAISLAELRAGIELADDARGVARSSFLDRVLETVPVEPYDLITAEAHGRLLAHVHRAGTKRGAHDLIIAATAAATGRIVLTGDRKARFGDLPGVECIELST